MGIDIKYDKNLFKNIGDKIVKENGIKLEKYLSDTKLEIVKRTSKGLNASRRSMGTYSAGYQKYRKSIGRTGNRINLVLTQNMLNSMQYQVSRASGSWIGKLFFNESKKARPQSKVKSKSKRKAKKIIHSSTEAARFTNKKYDWFRLSKKQFKQLNNLFRGKK